MPNPIDQAKELLELHGKATQGEWIARGFGPNDNYIRITQQDGWPDDPVCDVGNNVSNRDNDAAFIIATHSAVPFICQSLIESEERVKRLESLMREAIGILARNTPMVDSGQPGGEIADAMDRARFVLSNALQPTSDPSDTIPFNPSDLLGFSAPALGDLDKSADEPGSERYRRFMTWKQDIEEETKKDSPPKETTNDGR